MAKNESKKKTSEKAPAKKRETLYQLKTKRTSGIIKSYITFTYRIMHPKVTTRLVLYGVLIALPGIFFFRDLYWRIFFTVIGIALILLGFFRQYISLAITKKNDPDYINGTEFTYDFNADGGTVLKDDVVSSHIGYKDITAFYYDEGYYYLALAREVHVFPKDAFTVGTAEGFEEFIYKKSKKPCRWLPNRLSDRIKKRRAERAVARKEISDKK